MFQWNRSGLFQLTFRWGCVAIALVWSPLPAAELREMNPPDDPAVTVTTAIVGGRLIDGNGGEPIDDAVVVVRGNRILAAGPREEVDIPVDAERLELDGASILPGMIDTHFHSRNDVEQIVDFELRNGITSLRDPGHPFKYYETVLQSDAFLSRIFLCGGHLDGPPAVWPDQAALIETADEARRAVNEHVDRGASAIKIYFRLPLEHIAAACEAADERGVPVTAHLELVDADDAIGVGVDGIEHATSFGTTLADPKEAEEFKRAVRADSSARRQLRHRLWAGLDLTDSRRVQPLLQTILDHGVFVSPTLAVFERQPGKNGATETEVRGFENMLRFVGLCHAAGAKIVVGSHSWVPFAENGKAYRRELELLVASGMTPQQAITAATKTGAEFLGIEDRLGTIEPGKTADLIIVDGRPDEDITAIDNVARVMLNGRWFEKGSR